MKRFSLLLPLLASCAPTPPEIPTNKPLYKVGVGDTVPIYYTTNSCCYACFTTPSIMEYAGAENVVPYPEDCAGCNSTDVRYFIAKTPGTDTIWLNILPASEPCTDTLSKQQAFVVVVH